MLAYAKINLTLEVLARQADGYHALRSVMLPIALADELEIAPAAQARFECDPPQLTADNLVTRTLARIGLEDAPFALTLRKRIPVGAGLGGGSSDAAMVLRAAMDGTFGGVPERDWIADARALGSDVPFFLAQGGALVEGTGERVTALGALPPWSIVLIVPGVHVATPSAFAQLARERSASPVELRPRRDDYAAAIQAATNDFEPIVSAAYPEVRAVLDALRAAGADHAMLSGSGGACFALCPDAARARRLAAKVDVPPGASLHVVPFAPTPAWRAPTAG
jgi:4-diphosphocytidyl-2-C-methyl-D-erythritol kinase